MTNLQNEFLTTDSFYRSFSTSATNATQTDIDGLMQIREEEKMAGDVYHYYYEKYNMPIFKWICESEAQHTEAVLSIIKHYKLNDPAKSERGEFTNVAIQDLYEQLTKAGSTLEDALSTGAFIEEYDIADLKKLIAISTNEDIKRIYNNLMIGSFQHLKGFAKELALKGIIYEPKIMDVEEYKAFMNK